MQARRWQGRNRNGGRRGGGSGSRRCQGGIVRHIAGTGTEPRQVMQGIRRARHSSKPWPMAINSQEAGERRAEKCGRNAAAVTRRCNAGYRQKPMAYVC